jgi:hypothetical protein
MRGALSRKMGRQGGAEDLKREIWPLFRRKMRRQPPESLRHTLRIKSLTQPLAMALQIDDDS